MERSLVQRGYVFKVIYLVEKKKDSKVLSGPEKLSKPQRFLHFDTYRVMHV